MQTVLIVIHLMVVAALVVVVLLQRSEGGALGMGGGSGFMSGRGQANVLTRATAILATLFFLTSLGLTLLANYGRGNRSIFDTAPAPAPAGSSQPAPAGAPPEQKGTVLDQLRRMEEQRANGGGGGAPAEPTGTPQTPASQAPSAPKPAPGR